MIVREIIDDIEQLLQVKAIASPGRSMLTQWMSQELNGIVGLADWDWAQIWLDPAISTVDGTAEYQLPDNFPDNFVRFGDEDGDKWCCKLDDGSSETFLTYKSPVQFHSNDFTASSDGRPVDYTILTTSSGVRKIKLFPTPDDDYEIKGLYIPTDWKLTEQDQVPPIPGNCEILKSAVLRRLDANVEIRYQQDRANLLMRVARQRRNRLSPVLDAYTGRF